MKKSFVLLLISVVWANEDIVFPDEWEAIQKAYANSQRANASLYPMASNSPVSNNGFASSASSYPAVGETFYPIAADLPSLSGGSSIGQANDPEAQYWTNHVNNILAKGVNNFALDLDRELYRSLGQRAPNDRPNVIFSPLSIVSTLVMLLLGSSGVTFNQLAKVLGLQSGVDISSHSEAVHQMFGLLLKSIEAKPSSVAPEVSMASGLFVQNGYPIRDEFKAISQQAYNNEVINLDFIDQPSESKTFINEWVGAKTRGKIPTIIDQPLDADTRLIIASALYFTGEWNRYFFPRSTARRSFAVTPTESVMVDMMFNGGTFRFYEDKQLGVKILGLPYKGLQEGPSAGSVPQYQATMYVMLPTTKDADALSRLESRLNADNIEDMIGKMKDEICTIGVPRMKLSSGLNLNRALYSLGLTSLFDSRVTNLGLLSPGYNETATTGGQPTIFTRSGHDEDDTNTSVPRNARPTTKNNYFRYEDKHGGYNVQQWGSGFFIEKITSSLHRKRSVDDAKRSTKTRREKESYEIPAGSSDNSKMRFVEIGKDKYKFNQVERSKRQVQPRSKSFGSFVDSRGNLANYGLDALRNSGNIGNPGLFASDIFHKVVIDVTETGTTAAAATKTLLQRGGDIKMLLANRPFLFFIRHEHSKIILFWGSVNKPNPNY